MLLKRNVTLSTPHVYKTEEIDNVPVQSEVTFWEVKFDRTDFKTSFVILNIFFHTMNNNNNKILLTFLIIFLDLHRMPKVSFELVEDWKQTL